MVTRARKAFAAASRLKVAQCILYTGVASIPQMIVQPVRSLVDVLAYVSFEMRPNTGPDRQLVPVRVGLKFAASQLQSPKGLVPRFETCCANLRCQVNLVVAKNMSAMNMCLYFTLGNISITSSHEIHAL